MTTKHGRYFQSRKAYETATGKTLPKKPYMPNISVTGSVKGMRRLYWGYECDVVRIGNWIYKVN